MRGLIWAKAALAMLVLLVSPSQAAKPAAEPMPAGFGVRMTFLGPVFVNAEGMTLYTSPDDLKPNISTCTNQRIAKADSEVVGVIPTALPNADTRRTCVDKHPPLVAPAGSKPIGKWSFITREDGRKQWTYGERPVYTSARDRLPGDVNEAPARSGAPGGHPAFQVMMAPLPGAPPEVATLPTVVGVVYAYGREFQRKPLYISDQDRPGVSRCDIQCVQSWHPLQAATSAAPEGGDWSIIRRQDGTRQWAYRKMPVYTYAGDLNPPQIAGRLVAGWQPIVLNPPPPTPEGITAVYTSNEHVVPDSLIYADSAGKTLYFWNCNEPAVDRLACDEPGDSPAYWTAVCGAPEKCARTWQPVPAPADAKPAGGLWSITTVDPTNPMRILTDPSEGVRVLTYRGRPLYTHAADRQPGDTHGKAYWLYDIADWYVVMAYGQIYSSILY